MMNTSILARAAAPSARRRPLACLLAVLCLALGLSAPARATALPPTATSSLAEALNPDGTLRAGATGSFDARTFRMGTAPDGRPVFRPTGTAGAGDERWQDGFNLPNGANEAVRAVVQSGTDTYICGAFTNVGNVPANNIAKWDGTAWSPLGIGASNGVSGTDIRALAVAGNGDVYVGGYMTRAGGVAVRGVAKWNGTAWSPLGTGANNGVNGIAVGATGKLYAGGAFTSTGDGSKVMARFGIYDPNAPLAATAATSAAPAALFPNPAQGEATLRLPPGAPRRPLTLTDARGRLVRCYPAPAGPDAPLDLRGLPNGLYLVRCGQFTQRLVVE